MRFLHLTTFYPPYSFGGDATFLYRLCHALGDAGHDVDVVHCLDSYHLFHPGRPDIAVHAHPRVTTHGLRSGYGPLSPLLSQQTGRPFLKARAIQRLLDRHDYDVVHYHNISLFGPRVLAMRGKTDTAVRLYTAHEHWLVCPTHVLWKYTQRPCDGPDCVRCMLAAKRPPQLWRYAGQLEAMSMHVDKFVTPSEFASGMHAARGFPRQLGVLPYFVERSDRDWQAPAARPHSRPYFLFVGRLEKIKGVQRLIDVWNQIDDVDLLVVGTGTFESTLRAQAGKNPRIRFLGGRSQDDLGQLYYHAEACLVPSLTYETFGIIIIEAFARQTPVIAHDLGALSEVVTQSGGGILYSTQSQLVSAIRRIQRSRALRNQLGQRGYTTFLQRWTPEAHLSAYFSLIATAGEQRPGSVSGGSVLEAAV